MTTSEAEAAALYERARALDGGYAPPWSHLSPSLKSAIGRLVDGIRAAERQGDERPFIPFFAP